MMRALPNSRHCKVTEANQRTPGKDLEKGVWIAGFQLYWKMELTAQDGTG